MDSFGFDDWDIFDSSPPRLKITAPKVEKRYAENEINKPGKSMLRFRVKSWRRTGLELPALCSCSR
jgi:hypothetical protein